MENSKFSLVFTVIFEIILLMPAENILKEYQPNAIYHIYNRGVEKRVLYKTRYDYKKFIERLQKACKKANVSLLAYCLMKNHYHLLVLQEGERDIVTLMRSLGTSYSMYFNYKYARVGTLCQSRYKARLVRTDEDLINVSRYIHRNPVKDSPRTVLSKYKYSSYRCYAGLEEPPGWLDTSIISQHFTLNKYSDYVENE